MKLAPLLPLATFLVAVAILWKVDTMTKEVLDRPPGRVPTGETHQSGGVTTPRYYLPGTREPEDARTWANRHFSSVSEFRRRKAELGEG